MHDAKYSSPQIEINIANLFSKCGCSLNVYADKFTLVLRICVVILRWVGWGYNFVSLIIYYIMVETVMILIT